MYDKRLFYQDINHEDNSYYSFDMYEYYYDKLYYIYKDFINIDLKIYVKNKIDNISSKSIEMNMISFIIKNSNNSSLIISSFKYPTILIFDDIQINLNMIEKSYLQIYDNMVSIIILTFNNQKYYSISITGKNLIIDKDNYVLMNPKIELQEMIKNEIIDEKGNESESESEIIYRNDTEIIYHNLIKMKSFVLLSTVNNSQYILPNIGIDYVLNEDKSNYNKSFHIDNMSINRNFDYDNYRDSLTFIFNNDINSVEINNDLCFDDFSFVKINDEYKTSGKIIIKNGKIYDEYNNQINSKEINIYKYDTINTNLSIEKSFENTIDSYLEIEYKDYKFIITLENNSISNLVIYEKMNNTYIKIYNDSLILSSHEYIFEYLNSTYKLIINYNELYLDNIFIIKRINERVRLYKNNSKLYIQTFKTMKLDNICTSNSNIRSNLIDYNEKYLDLDKDYKTEFKQFRSITGIYNSTCKDISPNNTNIEKIQYVTSNNFNNINQNQYTAYEMNGKTYICSLKNNSTYDSSETINLINTDQEINLTLEFT